LNKLQELSAALILLFGGDGPAAERAGDALLQGRIAEAVAEGGFSAIDYSAWRKAPGLAQLEFDDIRIARGPGTVAVSRAEMGAFSQALSFEAGDFSWSGDERSWRFDRVEVVPGGLFEGGLRISAYELAPTPVARPVACENGDAPRCALAAVGTGSVERFHMLFRGRDREAVVTLAWQAGEACFVAWTGAGRGSEDLAGWGRRYLAEPEAVPFAVARAECDLPDDVLERSEAAALRSGAEAIGVLDGREVLETVPVLVTTLFGLVAESYAYLLE
jgi:hypothetical protein